MCLHLVRRSSVQAICFNKKTWTVERARYWLSAHDYEYIGHIEETYKNFRFKIKPPEEFDRFFVKKKNGIIFIVGYNY